MGDAWGEWRVNCDAASEVESATTANVYAGWELEQPMARRACKPQCWQLVATLYAWGHWHAAVGAIGVTMGAAEADCNADRANQRDGQADAASQPQNAKVLVHLVSLVPLTVQC